MWLNGGPGCSSLVGLFDELGPASLPTPNFKPLRNPHSWNNNASIIFLDQPVNTGFSYSKFNVESTQAAAKDIYALLTLFFHEFTDYAKQDFHIAGESYGGHYVPAMTKEILSHGERNINLKSALIGNGLTHPMIQYQYYRPMACGEGGYRSVLTDKGCNDMDKAVSRCLDLISGCKRNVSATICQQATTWCNTQLLAPYLKAGYNPYDIRRTLGQSAPKKSYSLEFLRLPRVKAALGVEVYNFAHCNPAVFRSIVGAGDWMLDRSPDVVDTLAKIPVLVYAGDADFICNWLGNRAWTNELEWPGKKAFSAANLTLVRPAKAVADYGMIKAANGLAFMRIYKASHMVPVDQPEGSVDMMNRWVKGEWWN